MSTLLPTRWYSAVAPWREFDGLERMRQMIREAFPETTEPLGWMPTVDVVETDEELKLTAELPGVKSEQVEIELEGNVLTLRGEKGEEVEKEEVKGERRIRVCERSYGEFSRSFALPASVDPERIAAEFRNGVLTVHMPKTAEAKGRRIKVQAR